MSRAEKTWKVIGFQPFIVAGDKGILKYLQDRGFKTFPELWDETYDDELDLKKRTNKIIDNIKSLRGKSKSELQGLLEMVKPKIIHNKKLWFLFLLGLPLLIKYIFFYFSQQI